jgi:hypothetical protein
MPWVPQTVLNDLNAAHKQVVVDLRYLIAQQAALINQLREEEGIAPSNAKSPTSAKPVTVPFKAVPTSPAPSLAAVRRIVEESEAARKA